MSTQADRILAMRDRGRSWTEIAENERIGVREAKSIVSGLKSDRRRALSRSAENESLRGLLDSCHRGECGHARKEHDEIGCRLCGPEHVEEILHANEYGGWTERVDKGCNEFVERPALTWMDKVLGRGRKPGLRPMPKPSDVKREGYGGLRGHGSRGRTAPVMPQVARKRKRNPGSRGKDRFEPPSPR